MIMPILAVKDVVASSAFYQEVLGFSEGVRIPGEDGVPNFAIVDNGDAVHIGLSLDQGLAARGQGVVLMVYVPQETNMEAYYSDVRSKGTPIVEELKTEYWGDQLFTISDPDGYQLSLCKTVKQMSVDEIMENRPQSAMS